MQVNTENERSWQAPAQGSVGFLHRWKKQMLLSSLPLTSFEEQDDEHDKGQEVHRFTDRGQSCFINSPFSKSLEPISYRTTGGGATKCLPSCDQQRIVFLSLKTLNMAKNVNKFSLRTVAEMLYKLVLNPSSLIFYILEL